MEYLDRDMLFTIAIHLDYPDLLKFCQSDKKINTSVCQQNRIWRYKLDNDYPDWALFGIAKPLRDIYKTIHNIDVLREKIKYPGTILTLYHDTALVVPPGLTKLPKEIGELTNLSMLYLSNLYLLEKLPKEIGNLINLEYLYLDNTNLTTVPPEIGNLTKLKILSLSGTPIVSLSDEVKALPNLIIRPYHLKDL